MELLVLKETNYVAWMLDEAALPGRIERAATEVRRLLRVSAAMPLDT